MSESAKAAANYLLTKNLQQVNVSTADPSKTNAVEQKGASKVQNKDSHWFINEEGLYEERTDIKESDCAADETVVDNKCVKKPTDGKKDDKESTSSEDPKCGENEELVEVSDNGGKKICQVKCKEGEVHAPDGSATACVKDTSGDKPQDTAGTGKEADDSKKNETCRKWVTDTKNKDSFSVVGTNREAIVKWVGGVKPSTSESEDASANKEANKSADKTDKEAAAKDANAMTAESDEKATAKTNKDDVCSNPTVVDCSDEKNKEDSVCKAINTKNDGSWQTGLTSIPAAFLSHDVVFVLPISIYSE
jgi:hypothetical protein